MLDPLSGSTISCHKHNPGTVPPNLRWLCWPLMRTPLSASLGIALLVGSFIAVLFITGKWYLAAIAVMCLLLSVRRFFLPETLEIAMDGIHRWSLGKHSYIPWSRVGAWQVSGDVVILHPRGVPGNEPRSAGVVLFVFDRLPQVAGALEYYLGSQQGGCSSETAEPGL